MLAVPRKTADIHVSYLWPNRWVEDSIGKIKILMTQLASYNKFKTFLVTFPFDANGHATGVAMSFVKY